MASARRRPAPNVLKRRIRMVSAVKLNPSGKAVSIINLTVTNHDFFSVVSEQPEGKREQTVLDIIAVGSAAMRRVQTTVDVDFVEKRLAALATNFEHALSAFEKQALDTLTKRFSLTESGSYMKGIGELIGAARKDCQGWTTDLSKTAKDLLDPEKKGSAVGRLEQLVEEADDRFQQMFDPDVKGSYAAELSERLDRVFGGNGRTGVLQSALTEAMKPVLAELRELKEKVEARKAAEQIIASTVLKGRPFEELVQTRLSELAQPFGDDVQAVGSGNGGSRAGDFLVTLNGSGKRLVVEARDRRQMSLPAIKTELERQKAEREADFAVYVSSGPEMLPQHVGDFQAYGDLLVTTIDNLQIAYRVARLIAMSEAPEGEVDVGALRTVLSKVTDTARSLRNVKSKASQVKKLADGIHSDADGTEQELLDLLDQAEQLLGSQAG